MASRPQTSPASTSPQTSPAFTKPLSSVNDPAGQYESNRPLEEGTLPEIETLTLPSYYKQRYTVDGASSRVLEKSFGRSNDYIELHIYDQLGTILYSTENFTEFTTDENDVEITDTVENFTTFNFDLQAVLKTRGFTTGKYTVVLNIQRKKIFDTFERAFSIKEISPTRREIKAVVDGLDNDTLELLVKDFIADMDSSVFFKDFIINFGEDRIVPCINMGLNNR